MSQNYYYWRDYVGVTPADAVPVTKDAVGEPIYVGQVYVHAVGIFVGNLKKDQSYIVVAAYGVHTLDKNIKILCSSPADAAKLIWKQTSSTNFLPDILGTPPVLGGLQVLKVRGTIYVGSIEKDNQNIIGSILLPDDATTSPTIYFVFNNQKVIADGEFKVLTAVNI